MTNTSYLPLWNRHLRGNVLEWLLEPGNPSVRYLTLTRLLGRSDQDRDAHAAQQAIVHSAPATGILDAQYPHGYWIKPGRGHSPKYRATMWQVLFLAELGAPYTPAIGRACEHLLLHAFLEGVGLFSATKACGGAYVCLNGNLLWALHWFGYGGEAVVQSVCERLACVLLDGGFGCCSEIEYGRSSPTQLSCVHGAVKALKAYALTPASGWSRNVCEVTEMATEYLLAHGLAAAEPPCGQPMNGQWSQLCFPLADRSDVLEALEVLAKLGWVSDPRIGHPVRLLLSKQTPEGYWRLERTVRRMWSSFGQGGQPNKWVTLRALHALAAIAPSILTEPPACEPNRRGTAGWTGLTGG